MSIPFIEDNDQTRARREHLEALRALVGNVYPNKFERSRAASDGRAEDTITAIVQKFSHYAPQVAEGQRSPAPEEIERANAELNKIEVRISGRIATPPRVMGKAAFVHLSDGISRLQIYVRKADVVGLRNDGEGGTVDGWELFGLLDHGDFIGVAGYLFITKTGELSVHVRELQFLAKALLPMPDKMHGIADPEIRQRQRYADLIASSLKVEREPGELTTREVFERRSQIIREMRRFLDDHGYIEVETPMLTPKATGAAARPFKTHHNALDIDLYARIAPELYLKRLVVGGFERVYELNRNFRNEGIDRTHNPEFTMLEFYCAYMDVNGMMDFCEEMLRTTVERTTGSTRIRFGEADIDFSSFVRLTMREAIDMLLPFELRYLAGERVSSSWIDDPLRASFLAFFFDTYPRPEAAAYVPEFTSDASFFPVINKTTGELSFDEKDVFDTPHVKVKRLEQFARERGESAIQREMSDTDKANLTLRMFEAVEPLIYQPTFITDFPKPVSPLSKASPTDQSIAERFELFIAGMECANGFSELNDPVEQRERFLEQMQQRERGDEEAMVLDEDYIRALSYGMPPAAGIGVGIDRLVMLLTNQHSIRDVILFPHMRPERKAGEATEETKEQ